ncbi:immunity 26/phosphotriesterase HocA family protein [Prosthecobacter sp.]
MKSPTFPFHPKSTVHLEPGMFWEIPLDSGKFAASVILQKDPHSRTGFLAGLLNWIGDEQPTPTSLKNAGLVRQGTVHFKTIKETGGAVQGILNLSEYGIVPFMEREHNSPRAPVIQGYYRADVDLSEEERMKLRVASGWGYKVIKILAEKLNGA